MNDPGGHGALGTKSLNVLKVDACLPTGRVAGCPFLVFPNKKLSTLVLSEVEGNNNQQFK